MADTIFHLTHKPRGLKTYWLKSLSSILKRRYRLTSPISIVFVSPAAIAKLNLRHRGIDAATDVLSFQLSRSHPVARRVTAKGQPPAFLGEIVICWSMLKQQAVERGLPLSTEFKILTIHGALHLLGYEHDKPAERFRMSRTENSIFKALANK